MDSGENQKTSETVGVIGAGTKIHIGTLTI
jgi:hypothetical protein